MTTQMIKKIIKILPLFLFSVLVFADNTISHVFDIYDDSPWKNKSLDEMHCYMCSYFIKIYGLLAIYDKDCIACCFLAKIPYIRSEAIGNKGGSGTYVKYTIPTGTDHIVVEIYGAGGGGGENGKDGIAKVNSIDQESHFR